MADLLFRLVNAPPTIRRATALGLLVVAGAAAGSLCFAALSSTRQLQRDLQDRREMAGRLQAIAALKPSLLAQAQARPSLGGDAEFMVGESVAVIRGNMQAQANAIVTAQGANLISVSNSPAIESDGVSYLGIDIDLSGTVEAVHNTVFALESAKPFIVRSASFWLSGPPQEPGATQPPELTAQLHVFGVVRPETVSPADQPAP